MDINNKVEMLEKPEEQDLMDISSLLNQLDPTIVTPPNKKMIDAVESSNNHILIIRNQENRVIAMLTMITYPVLEGYSKAWIEDVIVDIKERGKGMGEALVLKAIEIAKNKNIKTLNLTSRPARVEANSLYQKLGFKVVGTNCYRYYLR